MTRFGLLLVVVGAFGCVRTLQASTTQPNPLADGRETLPEGRHLHIDVQYDYDMPQFRMRQSAWFSVVNRDRLRFHVDLVHKWDELANPSNWTAKLEDDHGHVYAPEAAEDRANHSVSAVWDMNKWQAVYNHWGDVVSARNNPNAANQEMTALSSVDVYRGNGDYVFHSKELMTRDVHWLRLTMKHKDLVYQFTWNFGDQLNPDETTEPPNGPEASPDQVNPTFIMPTGPHTPTANVL